MSVLNDEAVTADALFDICAAGDLGSLRILLKRPINVAKVLDSEERTYSEITRPLSHLSLMFNRAARVGSAETVKYLLVFANSHGVSYDDLVCRDGICNALEGGDSVGVLREMMVVQPLDVDTDLGHIGTPLAQAVGGGIKAPKYSGPRTNLVRFLLEHGADPNRSTPPYPDGPGAYLVIAAECSSLEIVDLLLQYGTQVEQSGALHTASQRGRVDVMSILLEHGADINESLRKNLKHSAKYRTRLKKENGIVSDATDETRPIWDGETPLHYSVLHRQFDATAWLVARGANPDLVDSKGWSARDMATRMGDAHLFVPPATSVSKF